MRRLVILFLIIISASMANSQNFTVSGFVREKSSGENLIGATVFIEELMKGSSTNTYGYYSINLEKGEYTIVSSYLGYQDYSQKIDLNKDLRINILLEQISLEKQEIIISGERLDKNIKSTEMSTIKMPVKEIKLLPAIFGEVDILKTIQLLPGVQSSGEGSAGFYVRGGGPDQNLILLDEAVVYNASHLFGFFSVFNADAINDVNLIKGGMPANYGGRLSSVLDISMKDGNIKTYHADGGVGLISSKLTLQGPIKKDTSSFLVSGRRTYIDVLAAPFISDTSEFSGSGYFFYDLNAKVNYRFSDKDRLYLSAYFGRDVFSFENKKDNFSMRIPWGNATTSLRWNHLFNSRLFMNTTAIFSDYQFSFDVIQEDFEMELFSGITDYNLKVDFSYFPNINHNIKFGTNLIRHRFIPSSISAKVGEVNYNSDDRMKQYANDAAIYICDEVDLTEKLKINAGLRATYFQQVGPFDRYIKNDRGITTDSIHYASGEEVVHYTHLEPRFSLRYSLGDKSSIKASFTQNYQYIHLATISSVSMPTDLWVPSSDIVVPQFGTQYAVGYFRNFYKNMFETSVEFYYKKLENQIEYKDGATPGDNVADNPDNNFTFGEGESYGMEVFFKKSLGKVSGWIGYTLSKTTRTFPELFNGENFPAKYDRRHDLSIITTYKFNEKWTVSAVFVYATGNTATLPVARYFISGEVVNEYGERNSYRMEPYHRLDFSITYFRKKKKNVQSSWNFSVYNAYNRHNPYFIYFDYDGEIETGSFVTQAKQVSLFPIIPSISWNFKF